MTQNTWSKPAVKLWLQTRPENKAKPTTLLVNKSIFKCYNMTAPLAEELQYLLHIWQLIFYSCDPTTRLLDLELHFRHYHSPEKIPKTNRKNICEVHHHHQCRYHYYYYQSSAKCFKTKVDTFTVQSYIYFKHPVKFTKHFKTSSCLKKETNETFAPFCQHKFAQAWSV